MASARADSAGGPADGPRPRRWPWFAAGFLLVFLGLAGLVHVYTWTPRADALMRCPLWEYYLVELRRAAGSSGVMGPASGSPGRAVTVAAMHLAASLLGGGLLLGVRWLRDRRRGR